MVSSALIVYVAEAVSLSTMLSLNALAMIVTVPLLSDMVPEQAAEADVGSDPSRVNLMVAPSVLQLRAMLRGEEYEPPSGLISGAEAFPVGGVVWPAAYLRFELVNSLKDMHGFPFESSAKEL